MVFSPRNKFVQLPEHLVDSLADLPECGSGYQICDVFLKGGIVHRDVVISGCQTIIGMSRLKMGVREPVKEIDFDLPADEILAIVLADSIMRKPDDNAAA